MSTGYEIRISNLLEDPEWDAFLSSTPGGHHVQTSCWARIKASLSWTATRIIITQGKTIVGGAQLLLRKIPISGKIGYVAKGPLLAREDPVLAETLIEEILKTFHQNNCHLIAIQPPNNGGYISEILTRKNFKKSTIELAPTASLYLDLAQGNESITRQLHHKTRQYIRGSERAGVKVEEGSYADLDTFYALHLSTSERQKFTPYTREYFNLLWNNLAPSGWIQLLIARQAGTAVSAMLIVPFGKTVLCKLSGWSGEYGNDHPNEALLWSAIQWSLDHGYDYFDFEGISPEFARRLIAGEKITKSHDGFKYGFGGTPILYPPTMDFVPNKILDWGYRNFPHEMYGDSPLSKVLERFRKR